MPQQLIDISQPNDGNGNPIRSALEKANANFTETYTALEAVTTRVADLRDPAQLVASGPVKDALAGKAPLRFPIYTDERERTAAERAKDIVDVRDFTDIDPTGQNSSLATARRALAQVPLDGALDFGMGRYAIDGSIEAPVGKDRLTLFGRGAVLDGSSLEPTNANRMLRFSGSQGTPVAVTTNVVARTRTISVADAAPFLPGAWAMLCSTQIAVGEANNAGYGYNTRGEWVLIRGTTPNSVTLDMPTVEGYETSPYTVVLIPTALVRDIRVEGLKFKGPGRGQSYLTSAVPPGPSAIYIALGLSPSIVDCSFTDFVRWAAEVTRSVDVEANRNRFLGRDLTTLTNQGDTQSPRFTGMYMTSCHGHRIIGNRGQGLRRMWDGGSAGTVGDAPIGRFATVAENTVWASQEGLGAHGGDRFDFVSNRVYQTLAGGISPRATNCRVLNNTFSSIGGSAIRFGGVTNPGYEPTAYIGDWEASGNRIDGALSAIAVTGDFRNGVARNNEATDLGFHAVYLITRNYESLDVEGGFYDLGARGTEQAIGVYQRLYGVIGSGQFTAAPGTTKIKTTIRKAWRGVNLCGGSIGTPMKSVEIAATFDQVEDVNIRLGSGLSGDDSGFFSEHVSYEGSKSLTKPANGFVSEWLGSAMAARPIRQGMEEPGRHPKVAALVSASPIVTPPIGNWQIGQRVAIDVPVAGLEREWVCLEPGTGGTVNRTGAIALDHPRTLTLTAAAAFGQGTWLRIAGAGASGALLKAMVVATSDDQTIVTLDRDALTAVSGAAISYAPPVFADAFAGFRAVASLASSGTRVDHTGSTAQTAVASVTIPALGPNDALEIEPLWAQTNNANAKTAIVKLGGTEFARLSLANSATAQAHIVIRNRNNANAQASHAINSTGFGASTSTFTSASVDTTIPQTLSFEFLLTTASDAMALLGYTVKLARGA